MPEGMIDLLTPKGTGRLFYKDKPVYLPEGLPGEHVYYAITHNAKKHAIGRIDKVVRHSPDRVAPPCVIAGECGGCQLQHYDYSAQVAWKQAMLVDAMSDISTDIRQPISGPAFHWRNKLQLDVDGTVIGLSERYGDAYVDMSECLLVSREMNRVLTHVRSVLKRCSVAGLSRILIREHTGKHMLVFYAKKFPEKYVQAFVDLPTISSLYLVAYDEDGDTGYGNRPVATCLYGDDYLWESVGGLRFPIGPEGFFQGNAALCETFVGEVEKACSLTKDATLWDLHAGSGLLGLSLAKNAKDVVLSESYPESRELGELVIRASGIRNARYQGESAEDSIDLLPEAGVHTLLLDPPRKGCSYGLLSAIAEKKPSRVVYVSCNLEPFVRASQYLIDAGYVLDYIQLLDMFPHTIHSETIAVFTRP
jgi:23S rRNA (uracil1939-C5)-methyltransferase